MPELTNAERLKRALEKPKAPGPDAENKLREHMVKVQTALEPHGLSIASLLATCAAKFHGIHIKLD